ncbi:uncharacterized protein K460DRAFT_360511 [Cucurbitaria berberidis CBS 394.84]|uniref:Uncharacterized protein n=1 Tax=Cucurbitaria berberidis CBS 394.84 TaxID=1168544 RepID=A0A9P4LCF3_9PLEO|nr:uncharacterized protein K460DRAFT_360511 [Cucurbitaria berberidis CBS 394.84]KAF1849653.1 hypothetical protein K460DRAFT_360511 [Cucurbitaria berberidis CBS 394.84]
MERSSFVSDGAYGSSHDRPSPMHSQSTISFPAFKRSTYSRAGHLPSDTPSTFSNRSPARTQPQWENLQRIGVRSSRHTFGNIAGNTSARPARIIFSSAGRRNVKR